MKKINIILISFSALFYFNCTAQTPELPRYGSPGYGQTENAYYKDIEFFNNQFVGTWLLTNGNTSLKLIFINRNMVYVNGTYSNFYTDVLVGEYQYIENGVEKINTLSNINANLADYWNYNLHVMSRMRKNARPRCEECADNEYRLNLEFHEPSTRNISGLDNCFVIRRFFENGVEKLKVWFIPTDNGVYYDENNNQVNFTGYSLPFGEYTLIKQ